MPDKSPDHSVYRQLGAEMRHGLKNIWLQAAQAGNGSSRAEDLFNEASGQLDEVVKTTESAAMNIMEIVEKQDTLAQESAKLLAALQNDHRDARLERLAAINSELRRDLLALLTTLSFQDIAGQRIKKVIGALHTLEASVLELYLASGLMLDAAEKDPDQNAAQLAAQARKAVEDFKESRTTGSELKGPDVNGASQAAIDDMLAQLGL